MHGGKCYDIKMMKAERRKEQQKINKLLSFARRKDAFLFILFALRDHPEFVRISSIGISIRRLLCARFTSSINIIELNCMHETNKIELKLIEVDARSYLGLLML